MAIVSKILETLRGLIGRQVSTTDIIKFIPTLVCGKVDASGEVHPAYEERRCIGIITRKLTASSGTAIIIVPDLPGLLKIDATVLNQCTATWYVTMDPTSTVTITDDVTLIGGDGSQDYTLNWDNPAQPGGGGQDDGVQMGLTQQCTQLEFAMRNAVGGSHRMNVQIHIWKYQTPICDHQVMP